VLKFVINQLAASYRTKVRRCAYTTPASMANDNGENEPANEPEEVEDEAYKAIVDASQFDSLMREADRYTWLMNHVMIRVVNRNGRIDYDILTFDFAGLITDPDDWKKIVGYWYYTGLKLPDGGSIPNNYTTLQYRKKFLVALEGDKCVKYEVKGQYPKETLEKVEEYSYKDVDGNPMLDIVLTYKNYPTDDLLNFTSGNDLFDAQIAYSLGWISISELIRFQSFKQQYAIIPDKEALPDGTVVGPGIGMKIIDPTGNAKVGVLETEAKISELWSVIRDRLVMGLTQYGIPASRFTMSGTPTSGVALKIDSRFLDEIRSENLERWELFEKRLFEVTRAVNNYHFPSNLIDVKAKFRVEFGEIGYPETVQEQIIRETFELAQNLKTKADLLQAREPDLDDDEAEDRIMANISKEKQFDGTDAGHSEIEAAVAERAVQGAVEGGAPAPKPGAINTILPKPSTPPTLPPSSAPAKNATPQTGKVAGAIGQ
jgi:hypothetical protein